jgi:hypothetical protein
MNFFPNINLDITKHHFNNIKYKDFDLVIGGGGFRGYYHIGSLYILKVLEQQQKISIKQIIGTSSGAIASVNYACNIDFNKWLESYNEIKNLMLNGLDLHLATIAVLKYKLPSNAHILCNQQNVKIVVAKFNWWPFGFTEVIFDNFTSFDHLINCLSAAINIPMYTSNNFKGIMINNNRYYDGFFCRLTPIIKNNNMPQLVIKTAHVLYPKFVTLKPKDSHINLLAMRGFLETKKFLTIDTNINKVIEWIEPYNEKNNSNKIQSNKTNYLFYIIPLIFYIGANYIK